MDPESLIRHSYAEAKLETSSALMDSAQSPSAATGRALHRIADASLRVIAESPAEDPIACARGCCWCCYGGRVGVTIPEAAAIAESVSSLPDSKRKEIEQRLDTATSALRRGGTSLRWRERAPCPFVDESAGDCTVYSVRPTKCRGWTAYDQEACRSSYEVGGDADPAIIISNLRMEACTGATAGHVDALNEHGLDGRSYDLEPAVLLLLRNDEAVRQWLAGANWTKDQLISSALQLTPAALRNEQKRLRRQRKR